ncbi:MAG: large-conductance mechanosensitive channel [Acidimicrobiia bacterium]|nr:MAG: large-conductance mechanosensitive channel [Acidimicrobiia bacterium]
MRSLWDDFKKFIMRGNVLDLAVAVVIGAAFTAVVNSFANDVLMALIGAVFGKPNFDDVVWSVGDGEVLIGSFITSLVNFLIVALGVFVAVRSFEALQNMRRRGTVGEEPEPLTRSEELLTEIRDLLRARR